MAWEPAAGRARDERTRDVLHPGLKRNATLLHTSHAYPDPTSPPVATTGPDPPWWLTRRAVSVWCTIVALTPAAALLHAPLGAWTEPGLRTVEAQQAQARP